MKICERCGADTVDARGICRTCGWNARDGVYSDYSAMDDTPSLGETRAADIPPGGYIPASPASQAVRSSRMNPYPTEARPTISGGTTSGGRFCGTCGARLESGTAFCGQCGTPVALGGAGGTGGPSFGASGLRQSGQEQYRVGSWSDGDGNDVTEMIPGAPPPVRGGFGRSGVGLPYGGAPYHPAGYAPGGSAPTSRSSQTARLIVGVLCLIGSIVSASTAIILALTMGH